MFLKRKSDFFSNLLCVAVCVSLLVTTIVGSDFFSAFVIDAGKSISAVKKGLSGADINVNSSSAQYKEDVFSPSGFGGGGYKSENVNVTVTPSDISGLMKSFESLYNTFEKSGDIKTLKMGATSKTLTYSGVNVDNKAEKDIDIKTLLDTKPSFGTITKDEPYILVYHTHTTEGYEMLDMGWYSDSYNSRTEDSARNMIRVGEELVRNLEKAGFKKEFEEL